MAYLVRAFPLRRPLAELEAFAAELAGPRREQTRDFYRRSGVRRELWHKQMMPDGPWILAVTEIDDVNAAAPAYAASQDEFDVWYKQTVHTLTGVDPNTTPLGPASAEVYRWTEGGAKAGSD